MGNRLYAPDDWMEKYTGVRGTLMQGIQLNNQFIGTGYNTQVRMLGDYGANIYQIKRLEEDSTDECV